MIPMILPADIPSRGVFDLEIATPVPTGSNGRDDWSKAHLCGISTLVMWPMHAQFPFLYLLDNARLPRVFLTEDWGRKTWEGLDGVVSWNGAGFDNRLIKQAAPDIYAAYKAMKHVDLMAICAALLVGVPVSKLAGGVPEDWQKSLLPPGGGFANQGWGLEDCAKATLGAAFVKLQSDVSGAGAPKAWQAGRYSEVATYCIGDVALTRLLYLHAWFNGFIISPTKGKVAIPRELL
jgi:hypothetical protein